MGNRIFDILNKIVYNTLLALYQPFWAAIFLSFLFMFLYLYAKEHKWKKENIVYDIFSTWFSAFKLSQAFRKIFILAFYTALILLRTVLNRRIWEDPLGNIFGGWKLYENGQLTTEAIENFMLFVPFSILFLWAFHKELFDSMENLEFGKTIWETTKIVATFSFIIEFLQLLFHLGTFQISDLCYNTLGGTIGGVIYFVGYKFKNEKN